MAGAWQRLGYGQRATGAVLRVQERAYVTGLRAANLVIARLGYGRTAPILGTEPDEAHIAGAKAVNRSIKRSLQALGLP